MDDTTTTDERETPRQAACGMLGLGAVRQLEDRGLAVVWLEELLVRDASDEACAMVLADALADRDQLAARVAELSHLLSLECGTYEVSE